LQQAEANKKFIKLINMCDEMQAHRYNVETKYQSLKRKSKSSPKPKKHKPAEIM